jgi:recombination protein RecA
MSKATTAALRKFEDSFGKAFGKDAISRSDKITPYEVISTGSVVLDYATGVGGLVEGRLHEYWGPDSIGKTTVAMQGIREAQVKHPDKMTAWLDVEARLDKSWAKAQGIDLKRMYLIEPDNAEEVADQMKMLVTSGFISMVVLDSIGAMIPEAEKEKDADQAVVALQAQRVTRMVKIAAPEARKSGICVLLINQVRANVSGYGKATTTGGGFALRHVTTMKMEFKRTATGVYKAQIDGEEEEVGHELAIKIERNSVAPKGRTAIINLFNQASKKYGPRGVDKAKEATTIGLKTKPPVIVRSGAWYTLPEAWGQDKPLQGEDAVVDYLREHPEHLDDLRLRIIATRSDEVQVEDISEPEGDPDAT